MDDRYIFKAKRIDWRELPKEKWWVKGYLFDDGITNSHRMFVGGLVIEPCKYIYCNEELVITGTNYYEIDKETICRPTGLKDRHGNLIFENDLMDGFLNPYLSGLDSEHDYFAEVCWCDDIAGFGICTHKYKNSDVRGSADGEVDLMEDFDSSKWEIIGNKFDNKELLESEE